MKRLLFLAPIGPCCLHLLYDRAKRTERHLEGRHEQRRLVQEAGRSPCCRVACTRAALYAADQDQGDGKDQPVTGHPYVSTIAIKVVNDHEIQETDKKDGKVVGTSTTTISPTAR